MCSRHKCLIKFDLQIFSPTLWGLSFHFFDSVLWNTILNKFDEVQVIYIFFVAVFLVSYLETHCQIQAHEDLSYVFF